MTPEGTAPVPVGTGPVGTGPVGAGPVGTGPVDRVARARRSLPIRLADSLRHLYADCQTWCDVAAALIATELGDYAGVVVFDPPADQQPAVGTWHRRPERRPLHRATAERTSPAALRDLAVSLFADPRVPVVRRSLADVTDPAGSDPYLTTYGMAESVLVPIRSAGGVVAGMVSCVRDGDSVPFCPEEVALLQVSAEQLRALLATTTAQAEERIARVRSQRLAEQRHRLLVDLVGVEQAERARVAADLHDDSVQMLAAAQLRLQVVRDELTRRGQPVPAALAEAGDRVVALLGLMRAILRDLEPVEGAAPVESVAQAVRAALDGSGVPARVGGEAPPLLPEGAEILYRAAKEVTAALRAVPGLAEVCAGLAGGPDALRLTVVGAVDPVAAVGRTPADAAASGLEPGALDGLRLRVEALDGALAVTAAAAEVRVEVLLPGPERRATAPQSTAP